MNLECFLKQNALKVENRKLTVSQRFVLDGEPVLWEIKAITPKLDEQLRNASLKQTVNGLEVDTDKYLGKLMASCIVFPDLDDSDLQDSYGVFGADNLLKVMLTAGEYANLLEQIEAINGFNVTMKDKVDTAKN